MTADPVNTTKTSQQFKKKAFTNNLKEILDIENISVYANKYEHPTVTLSTNFHKPTGEENPYVQFEYEPQKICKHT